MLRSALGGTTSLDASSFGDDVGDDVGNADEDDNEDDDDGDDEDGGGDGDDDDDGGGDGVVEYADLSCVASKQANDGAATAG